LQANKEPQLQEIYHLSKSIATSRNRVSRSAWIALAMLLLISGDAYAKVNHYLYAAPRRPINRATICSPGQVTLPARIKISSR
jgi:hypothetical protein